MAGHVENALGAHMLCDGDGGAEQRRRQQSTCIYFTIFKHNVRQPRIQLL